MNWFRRSAGVIAAVLLAAMGAAFIIAGMRLPGVVLLLVGGGAALWQTVSLRKSREDPYDLNRLWDTPPEIAEPDTAEELLADEAGTAYCHHCGHAVAGPFARCPDCGGRLR